MTRLRTTLALTLLWCVAFTGALRAQQQTEAEWDIRPMNPQTGWAEYDWVSGVATLTNGALISYSGAVLMADKAWINLASSEVVADGAVRIQQGDQVWVSEHIRYNFKTRQMEAAQFRTGQPPLFAAGHDLRGDLTNRVYYATNAMFTMDDIADPAFKIKARRLKIIPGKKIQAYSAVLYAYDVPVFYLPYYSRNLGEHASNINFTPGYRSLFGPYILGNYTWWWGDEKEVMHLDYRQKRGPGLGPDLDYNFGAWGQGSFKYYYTHDKDPNADELGVPIPENRQRVYASYQANPVTNLVFNGLVRYESDPAMVRDFFEGEYQQNPQPNTFIEGEKFWRNFGLDTYVEPRVNDFLQTVERLPEVKLTGYRQELGASPLYYESESSAGYYRQLFAENGLTNVAPPGLDYSAARADTFHQVLLPETFFGWLNVTPRVGGRFTAYSEATGPGGTNSAETRGVFNTGAEVTFTASRVWPEIQNSTFDVDGLRHILQPSVNYVFVPNPSTAPSQLPQFDTQLPSLRLLPIEYPDYNSIDSIQSQNVIRWGLRNKLQTKREGAVANLVSWDLYTDWNLKPLPGQTTFADLYSDLTLHPRSWLVLESLVRYDINGGDWRMSYSTITILPSHIWSWSVGHYYLRDDFSPSPTALGPGNNVFSSTLTYRVNENWGFRAGQYYDAQTHRLQQQSYTVYRDMRSWTAALSFLLRDNPTGPQDYGVAFTFSLKAYPRLPLGGDVGGASPLLGR
jgi:lipopolysaccharide assembly outer membrane protein LptD (OstA)